MHPIFVDRGITQDDRDPSKTHYTCHMVNKGNAVRRVLLKENTEDSNIKIKKFFRNFVDTDEEFFIHYVQNGKNSCNQGGEIRFWTLDDKCWVMTFMLKISESGEHEMFFGFARKYEESWIPQTLDLTSDREELR